MAAPTDRSSPQEEGRTSDAVSEKRIQDFTDDLLVEIFSRLPSKSICRFKCVSREWLRIIHDPVHRKRLPHSLAGFFYNSTNQYRFPVHAVHFKNASGHGPPFIYPSFAFLPSHRRLTLLDCCNGLLLCRWYDASLSHDSFRYVVCNPATGKWVMLPDPGQAAGKVGIARLGFDAAVSSQFHVFLLLVDSHAADCLIGAHVYSSESNLWIHKDQGWGENTVALAVPGSATVYLHGHLYFRALHGVLFRPCLAAVDTKGEKWSIIDIPCSLFCDDTSLAIIQNSQGCLYYVSFTDDGDAGSDFQLHVYALKDYSKKEWELKYSVEADNIEGFEQISEGQGYFEWIAIVAEYGLIFFFDSSERTHRRYNMDLQQVTELQDIGESEPPYLPYVPLYRELPTLHK